MCISYRQCNALLLREHLKGKCNLLEHVNSVTYVTIYSAEEVNFKF